MKEQLEAAVKAAEQSLVKAKQDLEAFMYSPENNMFDDLEEACVTVEEKLRGKAYDDCEGSYNCGQEEYQQEFIVNGVHYVGTLKCEYNRHAKEFYYIEEYKFTFAEKALTK